MTTLRHNDSTAITTFSKPTPPQERSSDKFKAAGIRSARRYQRFDGRASVHGGVRSPHGQAVQQLIPNSAARVGLGQHQPTTSATRGPATPARMPPQARQYAQGT